MKITSEIVSEIIENKDIYVDFQPIYSLNTKKVIGLEALARGDYHGDSVSPTLLFNYARENDCVLDVDRLCREKAMNAFTHRNESVPTLFINFETSVLNNVVPG
ncbi:MAG: EAL domain-containing protein, partial [Oscillospiraceae bacterium]|nr:EAL domain-containing protein [Oscillospiraceae bacterium]